MSAKILDFIDKNTLKPKGELTPEEMHKLIIAREDKVLKSIDPTFKTGVRTNVMAEEIWCKITCDKHIDDFLKADTIAKLVHISKQSLSKKDKVNNINAILAPLGIFPIGIGTNRAAYQSIYDGRFVFKIALDDVGRKDSPREFINQQFLKPFVTKIFEVSSDGSIALVESVFPIQNRADFKLFAPMLYKGFLMPFICGRYAMDDIGVDNFMNYGVRPGFGPVLLDFPYVYGYDYEKMTCSNKLEDGTVCNGHIEYEVGFMYFVCPKCGQVFRASEIGKPIYDRDDVVNIVNSTLNNDKVKIINANENSNIYSNPNDKVIVRVKRDGKVLKNDRVRKAYRDYSRVRTVGYQKKF